MFRCCQLIQILDNEGKDVRKTLEYKERRGEHAVSCRTSIVRNFTFLNWIKRLHFHVCFNTVGGDDGDRDYLCS